MWFIPNSFAGYGTRSENKSRFRMHLKKNSGHDNGYYSVMPTRVSAGCAGFYTASLYKTTMNLPDIHSELYVRQA